jgi:formate dehydrogenase subunit gamma
MSASTTVVQGNTRVPPGRVLRYTFKERICHWVTSFSYLYVLATGLAFYSPYLYWLAALVGGGPTARFWHPLAGLVFFGGVLWMHALWKKDMQPIPEDQEWNKKIKHYIEHEDHLLPPQGRFNAGQKMFYWGMLYAGIALVITGVIMWFPEMMPRSLHWVLPIMVFLHVTAALVTIAGFIIHVYMGVFMIPSLPVIIRGYDSEEWAKQNHRLWYDKVKKEQ